MGGVEEPLVKELRAGCSRRDEGNYRSSRIRQEICEFLQEVPVMPEEHCHLRNPAPDHNACVTFFAPSVAVLCIFCESTTPVRLPYITHFLHSCCLWPFALKDFPRTPSRKPRQKKNHKKMNGPGRELAHWNRKTKPLP